MINGEQVTTNRPRAISRFSPYFSLMLDSIASLLDLRSSLLKVAVRMMVAATNEAIVSAIKEDVASAAVPAREADTHMIPNAMIHIYCSKDTFERAVGLFSIYSKQAIYKVN